MKHFFFSLPYQKPLYSEGSISWIFTYIPKHLKYECCINLNNNNINIILSNRQYITLIL